MTISELIKELEEIKEQHGDVEVYHENYNSYLGDWSFTMPVVTYNELEKDVHISSQGDIMININFYYELADLLEKYDQYIHTETCENAFRDLDFNNDIISQYTIRDFIKAYEKGNIDED